MANMADQGAAGAAPLLPGVEGLQVLLDRIGKCSKKTWSILKSALGVADRPAAQTLVTEDVAARRIAESVLGEEQAAAPEGEPAARKPVKAGVQF